MEYCIRRNDTNFFISQVETFHGIALPWKDEMFDAFVVLSKNYNYFNLLRNEIEYLVGLNCDWIETFGSKGEELHDFIDLVSVEIGRQLKIGDGSPMTAWHTELEKQEEIADYMINLGHGGTDNRLILTDSSSFTSEYLLKILSTW